LADGEAEMIPVEPEQDNACAGKVADFFLFFCFQQLPADYSAGINIL
jgi:hypothetical protein